MGLCGEIRGTYVDRNAGRLSEYIYDDVGECRANKGGEYQFSGERVREIGSKRSLRFQKLGRR